MACHLATTQQQKEQSKCHSGLMSNSKTKGTSVYKSTNEQTRHRDGVLIDVSNKESKKKRDRASCMKY